MFVLHPASTSISATADGRLAGQIIRTCGGLGCSKRQCLTSQCEEGCSDLRHEHTHIHTHTACLPLMSSCLYSTQWINTKPINLSKHEAVSVFPVFKDVFQNKSRPALEVCQLPDSFLQLKVHFLFQAALCRSVSAGRRQQFACSHQLVSC